MPENAEELQNSAAASQNNSAQNNTSAIDRLKEQFFYAGDARLKDVRRDLIDYSLRRAEKRLCTARERVGEQRRANFCAGSV